MMSRYIYNFNEESGAVLSGSIKKNNRVRAWILPVFLVAFATLSCSDNPGNVDPDLGTIVVDVITTGGDPNPAGYTVSVQGSGGSEVEPNGIANFNNLDAGSYQVELTAIAAHCSVEGQNPQSVQVALGESTSITFEVHCATILRNQIVFVSNRDGGFRLYKTDPQGSEITQITEFTVSGIWKPAISPDGLKITFVSTGQGFNTQQIWVVDADGTNWVNLTQDSQRHSEFPVWSPDGTQIAYHAYLPGGEGDIFIMNANGSGKTNITNSATGDWWPDWSPDGSKIAFHTIESGVPNYISTMNVDGSGRAELFKDSFFYRNPAWSPDGSKIAFQSNRETDSTWEIMVANADGSNIRSVTNLGESGVQHRFNSWSPDGSQLTFDSNRDHTTDAYDIFVISADGSGLVNLTNNTNTTAIFPQWSGVE